MAAGDVLLSNYTGIRTLASTELNSLAANTTIILATFMPQDNSSNQDWWDDVELLCSYPGGAPAVGESVDLYYVPSIDGTNFATATTSFIQRALWVGSFELDPITTAQRLILRGVNLPPQKYNVALVNKSSAGAFASSGNTLRANSYKPHNA